VTEQGDENLWLFTAVNEAHARVEGVESALKVMRGEVDGLCGRGPEALATAAAAAEAGSRLRSTLAEAGAYEAQLADATTRVTETCTAVHALFEGIGCSTEAVKAVLPATTGPPKRHEPPAGDGHDRAARH
jgi:hypothetical protein